MNFAEQFKAVASFRQPHPIPLIDMGYWNETIDRWVGEGLPAEVLLAPEGDYVPGVDLKSYWAGEYERAVRTMKLADYLGIENWIGPARLPIHETIFPYFEEEVLADKGAKVVVRDRMGVVLERPKSGTAFPAYIEFPVKTRGDYEKLISRLDPSHPGRYGRGWEQWAAWLRSRGKPVSIWVGGFFGYPRDLMGFENLCLAYHTNPELVQVMVEDRCSFIKRLFEPALNQVHVDCVIIWEDMAFNHGSMISPKTFRRFMLPYYQEINDFFHKAGVDCILVDCDGNIVELCGLFMEGRADGVFPMEIAAGSDPRILRERYPNLVLMGGVDKRTLADGPDAIDRELERLAPLVEKGGYLLMSDHLVPPDVSLENYQYYLKKRKGMF
jgi:hypothetical protein